MTDDIAEYVTERVRDLNAFARWCAYTGATKRSSTDDWATLFTLWATSGKPDVPIADRAGLSVKQAATFTKHYLRS